MASQHAVDLNEQIVRVARLLPFDGDHEFGFDCECGCGEIIGRTLAEFEDRGAWIDGHRPT